MRTFPLIARQALPRSNFCGWLFLLSLLYACGHVLIADVEASFAEEPELVEAGKIRIEQYQAAFLFSGNLGGGTLSVGGKSYSFTVGGLGIGGIGVSKIEATGTVYNLKSVKDIEGVYGQARYGFALADKSTGKLWLENPNGVYIELQAKRTGLALALGADGVVIQLD